MGIRWWCWSGCHCASTLRAAVCRGCRIHRYATTHGGHHWGDCPTVNSSLSPPVCFHDPGVANGFHRCDRCRRHDRCWGDDSTSHSTSHSIGSSHRTYSRAVWRSDRSESGGHRQTPIRCRSDVQWHERRAVRLPRRKTWQHLQRRHGRFVQSCARRTRARWESRN